MLSSSFSRENSSTASESPIFEGDEEHHAGGRKKSVSFSEQVDKTSYKSNATVSALHNTLKNKRRRARKREEKRCQGKDGRRRRTSSGGSYSSDDLSSTGQPEEFDLGDNDLDPHTRKVSNKNTSGNNEEGFEKDDEVKSAHTPPETKLQNKEDEPFRAQAVEVHTGELKNLREGSNNGQIADAPVELDSVELQDRQFHPGPTVCSVINGQDNNANKIEDTVNENGVFRDPKPKSDGDNVPDSKNNSCENSSKKSKNKKKKHKYKQVKSIISEGSNDEDDRSERDQTSSTAEGKNEDKPPEADTLLRWEDANPQADDCNEHKTQCAFQFSNSLMYDLDEE